MFDNLTERLSVTLKKVTGQSKLTDDNIKEALREVQMALLEADVALPVVRHFMETTKQKAIGTEVQQHLNSGQAFLKIVQNELLEIMGGGTSELNLASKPPVVILMAGLQGVGKTTTVAKLGSWIQARQKKSVMVVSVDVYRPAAIKQLEILASEANLTLFPSSIDEDPVDIAKKAIQEAKNTNIDVLLIDTAGRLHVDAKMMDEIRLLHESVVPTETLFVVDAMTGQDAANVSQVFHEVVPLTGVILSKIDGDARGGAALSVRQVTGKPIKFMGTGEKLDAFEVFHPERIVSRILGMGDMLSLIEDAEQKLDQKKADKLAKKLKKGKTFNLEDFRDQIQQMRSLGDMSSIMGKIPGANATMAQAVPGQLDDKSFLRMEAIINSMTPKERSYPDIINGSRKRRVAKGSGCQIQDVNRLIKQHKQMSKMMKKVFRKGGVEKIMQNMGGGLPGGMIPAGKGRF